MGEVRKGHIFDFAKLVHSLIDPNVGPTLLISLFYFIAFGIYIFTFQPFSVKVMGFSTTTISIIFTLIGVIGLFAQLALLPRLTKFFGDKKSLMASLITMFLIFFAMYFTKSRLFFIVLVSIAALANSCVGPLIQTILSKETDERSQGSIQGLNSSYASIGTTIGPVIGGALAVYYVPLPYVAAGAVTLLSLILSLRIKSRFIHKESAF